MCLGENSITTFDPRIFPRNFRRPIQAPRSELLSPQLLTNRLRGKFQNALPPIPSLR